GPFVIIEGSTNWQAVHRTDVNAAEAWMAHQQLARFAIAFFGRLVRLDHGSNFAVYTILFEAFIKSLHFQAMLFSCKDAGHDCRFGARRHKLRHQLSRQASIEFRVYANST